MLQVEGVAKTYSPPPAWLRPLVRTAAAHPVHALADTSFTLGRGEVIGLVGPNGAGKTTLIKILAHLVAPTRGRVLVDGLDPTNDRREVCRRLGLVLEADRGLYDRLSGRQNLEFYARMSGVPPAAARARAAELLELFELEDRDKLTFGYSAGMRMRLSLARALVASPPLVVLDEPTRSLDPVASRAMVRMLRQLAADGHAVLFSNHRLDEVVAVSNRVIVLVGGHVRFDGAPEALDPDPGRAAEALADLLEREAGRQ